MTAVCCPTIAEPAAEPGWRRYSQQGVSETLSLRLASVHPFPSRSIPQQQQHRIMQDLATQPWFGQVSERLRRFLSYGPNWNEYGEMPISERAVRRTLIVLHRVAINGPEPVVVPVSDGGIQIEWYYGGTEIEVEVPPSGPVSIYVARPDGSSREEDVQRMDNPIWDELRTIVTMLEAPAGA